jgi:hypothetical protein
VAPPPETDQDQSSSLEVKKVVKKTTESEQLKEFRNFDLNSDFDENKSNLSQESNMTQKRIEKEINENNLMPVVDEIVKR